ncbi:MAG: relaxase/mobilization nuclease domain-containing protein [Providencia rustigianii]|uniref:relaxase/mobilization nuclease domain-containing protein n=1 Tax=Providencia rustigianii TaxID=158850 RepID=UPI003F382930
MIVGFSSYGQGSGNAATDYLTDKSRTTEREENPPEVIKGDIESTNALINSLEFQHKYTSGVLSFSPDETITPEMEKAIIERFEQVAFSGMEKDRYDISWVRHSHAGHHELHFITPRVDLETGKSFNIKPPGKETQAVFDDFRSEINARYGLSDPDDPSRKRDIALSSGELKAKLTDRIDVKETVNEILDRQVIAGAVQNRADVVDSLKEMGFEINREGKNYLSIKDPESGEKFRLKGTIYERDFTPSGTIEKEERARLRDYSKPDERVAGEFAERVNRHIEKRAEYNANRYGKSHTQDFQNDIGAERLTAIVSRDFPVSRYGDRDMALHGEPEQRHHAAFSGKIESATDYQRTGEVRCELVDRALHDREKDGLVSGNDREQSLQGHEEQEKRSVPATEEKVDDRTGEESFGVVRSAFREIEDTADQNGARIESLGAESERQGQQDREFIDAAQRFADTLRQHLAAIERYVIARIAELKEKRLATAKESQQKAAVKPVPLPQKPQPQSLPTIDGKPFDQLIIIPVIKNEWYGKTVEFKAGFLKNNEIVSELKHLTKSDITRMGVKSDGIESRKVISLSELNSSQIESPLRHAERTLNEFKENLLNKTYSHEEYAAIKAERARLEDNVKQIKKTIDADKPMETNTAEQSASKGLSM